MNQKTVRELGGEVWAEITHLQNSAEINAFSNLDLSTAQSLIDLLMGVLARHEGATIVNDEDLPVAPLGKQYTNSSR